LSAKDHAKKNPDPRDMLDRLAAAIRSADVRAMGAVLSEYDEARRTNTLPVASFDMWDWRINEAGDDADTSELTETQTEASAVVIERGAYGLVVRTTPPGAAVAQELSIEFDRGSTVVRPYLMSEDNGGEPLVVMRSDDRGAQISRPYADSQHLLARPASGSTNTKFEQTGEWSPADEPPSAPRP